MQATKENGMLKALDKMETEWAGLDFRIMPYKDSGEVGWLILLYIDLT